MTANADSGASRVSTTATGNAYGTGSAHSSDGAHALGTNTGGDIRHDRVRWGACGPGR